MLILLELLVISYNLKAADLFHNQTLITLQVR